MAGPRKTTAIFSEICCPRYYLAAGANEATEIELFRDVKIDGKNQAKEI